MRRTRMVIAAAMLASLVAAPLLPPSARPARAADVVGTPYRLGYTSYASTQLRAEDGNGVVGYSFGTPDAEGSWRRAGLVWVSGRVPDGGVERDGELWFNTVEGPARRLTNNDSIERHPELSPDGRWVAYSSDATGNFEIWLVNVANPEQRRQVTQDPGDDSWPSWSPDGTKLVFASTRQDLGGDLFTVAPFAATPLVPARLTSDIAPEGQPSWSPDGARIAFTRGADVVTMPAAGGAVTKVVTGEQPSWAPTKGEIAYVSRAKDPAGDIWSTTVDGVTRRVISERAGAAEHSPAWQIRWWYGMEFEEVTYTEETSGDNRDIWSADPRARDQRNHTQRPSLDEQDPDWSADGQRLAYTEDTPGEAYRIMVADANGRNPVPLTGVPADYERNERDPSWSPDGTMIAYTIGGNSGLPSVVQIIRVADKKVLGEVPYPPEYLRYDGDFSPAWSPDGTRIAFIRRTYSSSDTYLDPPAASRYVSQGGTGEVITRISLPDGGGGDVTKRAAPTPAPGSTITGRVSYCDNGLTVTFHPPEIGNVYPGETVTMTPRLRLAEPAVVGSILHCRLTYLVNGVEDREYSQLITISVADRNVGEDQVLIYAGDYLTDDPRGMAVHYEVNQPATCDKPAGSVFPIGSTVVSCTNRNGTSATAVIRVRYRSTYSSQHLWVATLTRVSSDLITVNEQRDIGILVDGDGCPGAAENDINPAWSPDAQRIVYALDYGDELLCVTKPDGTDARQPFGGEFSNASEPAWSPDGQDIAFTRYPSCGLRADGAAVAAAPRDGCASSATIYLVPASGGTPARWSTWQGGASQPAYRRMADLHTTITPDPPSIPFFGTSTVTLTITNRGLIPAPATVATITLPSTGLKEIMVVPTQGACTGLTCAVGTIPPGAAVTVRITVSGILEGVHPVAGSARSSFEDGDPSDNSAQTRVTVGPPTRDLAVSVTPAVPKPGYVGGDPIVVTITVRNGSQIPFEGVRLTLALPPGLTPPVLPPGCTATLCDLGTMAPDEARTFTVTLPASSAVDTVLTASVTSVTPDPVPANNSASTPVVVLQPVLKLSAGVAQPGEVVRGIGSQFPPGAKVRLAWSAGQSTPVEVTADATGAFDAQVLVHYRDLLGARVLRCTLVSGTRFGPVDSTLLLVVAGNGRESDRDWVVRR